MTTVANEIRDTKMGRPHVVILGAGASAAAFPQGDRNGRKLPVLNDLMEALGIDKLLTAHSIEFAGKNFEEVYSDLVVYGQYPAVVGEIETRVRDYFNDLKLPDAPTIYDHLVLSLRPKDLIATFNWDPFLYTACWRNHRKAPLPITVYLHGNVAIGYCEADWTKGRNGANCSKCGKPYTSSKLLFPVKQKDYNSDPFTRSEWNALKDRLRDAYMVTVFGYSAPKTDVEAVALLKEGWGQSHNRELEQIELIDVKNEDTLLATWQDFIHTHHYQTTDNFYDSWIAKHPRRTCEAMWNQLMECQFLDDNPIPHDHDFDELLQWYKPLIDAEVSSNASSPSP